MSTETKVNKLELLADANITHHKCGKLPSELLKENEAMKNAMQHYVDFIDRHSGRKVNSFYDDFKNLINSTK